MTNFMTILDKTITINIYAKSTISRACLVKLQYGHCNRGFFTYVLLIVSPYKSQANFQTYL